MNNDSYPALCRKSAFGLAVTLTFHLWPWKPFQQFLLAWWIFAPSFIEIALVTEEIVSHETSVNGRPEGRPENIMLSANYCWWRHKNTKLLWFTYHADEDHFLFSFFLYSCPLHVTFPQLSHTHRIHHYCRSSTGTRQQMECKLIIHLVKHRSLITDKKYGKKLFYIVP